MAKNTTRHKPVSMSSKRGKLIVYHPRGQTTLAHFVNHHQHEHTEREVNLAACKELLTDAVDDQFGWNAQIHTFVTMDRQDHQHNNLTVVTNEQKPQLLYHRQSTGAWSGLFCAAAKEISEGVRGSTSARRLSHEDIFGW